ncbi:beta-ketoacyl synthase N-terminal-like domain-containing protein [Trinickia sp. NRRL B-1857]|uniref:beta-ketoacyl synthase N-terminal-like domain-containing protein n=1 Tax=Trinickia sp. NRRL B-1857 TaxID=3162879 RepID=UPI003D2C0E42
MEKRIKISSENPIVAGHEVQGSKVLPGLAYIDMLYQFFGKHGHRYDELELRNVVIYQPLVVKSGESIVLTIRCSAAGEGSWNVVVARQGAGDRHGDSQDGRYLTAEMHRVGAFVFAEALDEHLLADTASGTDLETIYSVCRARGLVHSGVMKVAGRMRHLGDAVIVDCRLAQGVGAGPVPSFHPALIDGSAVCAGAAWHSVEKNDDARLLLPLYYESFRAVAPLGQRCIARVQLSSRRSKNEIGYQTLEFFSSTGQKVAELKNLGSKFVRDSTTIGGGSVSDASAPRIEFASEQTDGALLSRADIERILCELIAAKLNVLVGKIRTDAGYFEMGLQSSDLLGLVETIQRKLGVTLAPTVLFEYATIAELAEYLSGVSVPAGRLTSAVAESPSVVAEGVGVRLKQDAQETVQAMPFVGIAQPGASVRAPSMDIAIIGLSGRYPQARNVAAFWENLVAGRDCVEEVPTERWDHRDYFDNDKDNTEKTYCKWGGFMEGVDEFDPLFFNISPREAEVMDPQARLFLETIWELLEDAGHTREILHERYRRRVGLYVGAMYQQYRSLIEDSHGESIAAISSYSAIVNRASYFFGLEGPSIAVDTMCSSSMVAIHMACKDLLLGECELAIAGGVNLSIDPKKFVGLSQAQLIGSHPDSRSFADADGFLPAEGVGAVLLKPLARAVADGDSILAVIKSSATNHSGRSSGYAVPNLNAQADLVERTLDKAGIDARSISYVEAAANGSLLGDPIEIAALNKAFGKFTTDRQLCAIGSVKSNIGHAEAASGISQLTKVVLQLRHRQLAPSIKADTLNPNLTFEGTPFRLQRTLQEWMQPMIEIDGVRREVPRRALINSFGAGGSYANLIVEEFIPAPMHAQGEFADGPVAMIFSAKTRERLNAVVEQISAYVRSQEAICLADLAYTLQTAREPLDVRVGWVVASRDELLQAMMQYLASQREERDRGDVDETNEQSKIRTLLSGRTGEMMMQSLLAERDLEKLVLLWTQGAKISWQSLYTGRHPHRISLPTYPFAKMKFRFAKRTSTGSAASSMQAPVIGEGQSIEEHGAPRNEGVERWVLRFLSDALRIPLESLNPASRIDDLGGDSIVRMRLARGLERDFKIKLSGRELLDHPTIGALSRLVRDKYKPNDLVADVAALAQPESAEAALHRERVAQPVGDDTVQALEMFRNGEFDLDELEDILTERLLA